MPDYSKHPPFFTQTLHTHEGDIRGPTFTILDNDKSTPLYDVVRRPCGEYIKVSRRLPLAETPIGFIPPMHLFRPTSVGDISLYQRYFNDTKIIKFFVNGHMFEMRPVGNIENHFAFLTDRWDILMWNWEPLDDSEYPKYKCVSGKGGKLLAMADDHHIGFSNHSSEVDFRDVLVVSWVGIMRQRLRHILRTPYFLKACAQENST